MTQIQLWNQELDSCLLSGERFNEYLPKIFSNILGGDPKYRSFVFSKISNIILTKDVSRIFFALNILLLASEKFGLTFVRELAQKEDLLDMIFKAAQQDFLKIISFDERGRYFFSKSPSLREARISINFVRLCFECLIYWQEAFGQSPECGVFLSYAATLKKKFHHAGYYHFIYRKYDLSQDLSIWNFANNLPRMIDGIEQETQIEEHVQSIAEESDQLENFSKNETAQIRVEEDEGFMKFFRKVTKKDVRLDKKAIRGESLAEKSQPFVEMQPANLEPKLEEESKLTLLEVINHKNIKEEGTNEPKNTPNVSQNQILLQESKLEKSSTNKNNLSLLEQTKKVSSIQLSSHSNILKNLESKRSSIPGKMREDKMANELLDIKRSIEKSRTISVTSVVCSRSGLFKRGTTFTTSATFKHENECNTPSTISSIFTSPKKSINVGDSTILDFTSRVEHVTIVNGAKRESKDKFKKAYDPFSKYNHTKTSLFETTLKQGERMNTKAPLRK